MALIVWKRKVRLQLKQQLEYAFDEFGQLTAKRWVEQLQLFEDRLRKYPASYTPVLKLRLHPARRPVLLLNSLENSEENQWFSMCKVGVC